MFAINPALVEVWLVCVYQAVFRHELILVSAFSDKQNSLKLSQVLKLCWMDIFPKYVYIAFLSEAEHVQFNSDRHIPESNVGKLEPI